MKSVALHNLGCKVNAYETDVMQQMLQENGYQVVPFDEKADIYIINTCSVTNIADRKSRQMLHKAKKRNPDAIVVAAGCYVQTGEKKLDACIDIAVGNNRKKDIVSILDEFLEGKKAEHTVIDISEACEYEEMQLTHTADHTRAYIKIQDGCNQFCSYCIIPYARGRVRSRQPEQILREVMGLAKEGYREIVLTGIHVSSYGIDFVKKDTKDYLEQGDRKEGALISLIQKIHETQGIERIRIGSLEPRIITEEFVSALSRLPKICPHFHLSLQSGCDATLQRMNRHYTAKEYAEKVQLLREAFENPAITTDVIVGFPGETEEEFLETKAFLEQIQFYEMHVFKYSKREGTAAAAKTNQIPEEKKNERSTELLELREQQSEAYRNTYVNQKVEVLLEEKKEIQGKTYWIGHTREYVKAAFMAPGEENLSNRIKTGTLVSKLQNEIMLLQA